MEPLSALRDRFAQPDAAAELARQHQQLLDAYRPGGDSAGNIDLNKRPVVRNPDGSISTVSSMSANIDGRETLLPTISPGGERLSNDAAIAQYRDTGQHLGKFDDVPQADAYAQALHEQQAKQYTKPVPTGFFDAIKNVGSGLARDIPRAANWFSEQARQSPEQAQAQLRGALGSAVKSVAEIPQRAFEGSERMRTTGEYDPAPMVDAAMLPMGTGAIAGVPLKAGEAVLGSGFVRSADEINRAAAASRQGISQPQLRKLYDELGLTGGEASDILKPSLAASQPEAVRRAAVDLKLADRAVLDTLSKAQRLEFQAGGKLPPNVVLPSREAAQPGLDAFAPVKKEVGRAEAAFDTNVERGIKPSIFDLSPETLSRTPDVPQFNLPRVAPEATDRLASVSRGGMARLERAAAAAPKENWGWYNLDQARDVFKQLHGAKGEPAFQAWLDGVAGTSMVNPIDNNLRSSTWYLQQALQGKPLPEVMRIEDPVSGKMVSTMAGGPPAGYGAKSQIQHADRVREYMTHTYDPVSNPKPISYRMNLSGNWMPRTVDTHDIRNMVGMPRATELFGENAGMLPKEYSYLESVGQRAADRAKSPQAAQQAATWVGGGEYTGLKSYPAPLLEALNRRAHVTGSVRDQSAWDALLDAFKGKQPLL